MSLSAGPAFRYGATSLPKGFYNAQNEDRVYIYDPAITEGDPGFVGNLLHVDVDKHQSWGFTTSLKYGYQLSESLEIGGVLNYQQYRDHEQLIGLGAHVTTNF